MAYKSEQLRYTNQYPN